MHQKKYTYLPPLQKKTKKHHNNNNNNNKAPTRFFPVNVNILQDTRSGSPWRKLMESRCDSIDGSMDVSASEVLKMSTKFKTDTLLSVKSTLARLLFLVSVCLFDSFFLSLFGFFRLSMRGSCRVDFWEIFRTFAQKPQAHCSKGFQQVPTQGNSGLDTKFMFSKGLEVWNFEECFSLNLREISDILPTGYSVRFWTVTVFKHIFTELEGVSYQENVVGKLFVNPLCESQKVQWDSPSWRFES